jgi:hypothetical protein
MPSFLNPDGSFFNESSGGPIMVSSNPASGSTIKMGADDRHLFVNASLLSSLTIWLPRGVEPGDVVDLCFETGVTSLFVRDGAGVIVPSAPNIADGPGAAISMKYISDAYGWFYWTGQATAAVRGDVVNAKDFGARGDGVTDDTEALNNMFSAAFAEGKTWYIPNGRYFISGPLTCYTGGRCDGVLVLVNSGQDWAAFNVAPDPDDITLITAATINAWTGLVKGITSSSDFAPYYGSSIIIYSTSEHIIDRLDAADSLEYKDAFTVDDPAGLICPPINQTKVIANWANSSSFSVVNRPVICIENLSIEFSSGVAESLGGVEITRPNTVPRR